ncbi:MAG: maleylpyruvate isomerase family mycothiol-dependent enzyme [Actinomycetales bacterium]|nr:MAG: maleylpyruvate isomerase family mycothiol-dependent enzyme [Actinomycetales bacterium]
MTTATLATAVAQLETLIAAVGPDEASAPTPCSEWVVRDLVDHVVHSTGGMTQMLRGEEVDWSVPVAHHDDPLSEFGRRGAELLVAADGAPGGLAEAELSVHTWDLATALGLSTGGLDPAVADDGYAFMRENLTVDGRAGAFEPEQQAPAGANSYERLAAFAGRRVRRL